MTLVMDGVRRSQVMRSGAATAALSMAVPSAPGIFRPTQIKRRRSRMTYVGSLDGVRRQVPRSAPLTPREMLNSMVAAPTEGVPVWAAPELETTEAMETAPRSRSWQRPVIAFGMVAAALVASGTVAYTVNSQRNLAATAETAKALEPKPATAPAVAPVATPTPYKAGLQELLHQFVAGQEGQFGIVVKDLRTGQTAAINPNRRLTSASLYKLFVAQQIYRMVDTGQLSYGSAAGGGTGRNIEGCLTIMINVSDNGCGRALGDKLGWGKQNEALHNAGYTETSLTTTQQTSAHDVALLLERLYLGTLNSPNANERFMNLLKDQRVRNRLPQGLPEGTAIAHKTGDLSGYVHDAGIVFGPKTNYLVVVTSGPWKSPGVAPSQFAKLSSQLWSFFQE